MDLLVKMVECGLKDAYVISRWVLRFILSTLASHPTVIKSSPKKSKNLY